MSTDSDQILFSYMSSARQECRQIKKIGHTNKMEKPVVFPHFNVSP